VIVLPPQSPDLLWPVVQVIQHKGPFVHERTVESMLGAVLLRLEAARSHELVQQLILIFVRLAYVNIAAVMGFLMRHQVRGAKRRERLERAESTGE
jgi:hypothetical protein